MKPERSSLLVIVTLMVVCGMSHSSLAQDVNWDDRFGLPNIYADVHALALTDNDQVYVGGRFGGSPGDINYVALWDGRTGRDLARVQPTEPPMLLMRL